MNSFSADWLSLREPADTRARSGLLTRAVLEGLVCERPLRILDLGAGTGSNQRYLADYFRSPQDWLLVDHDEALLAVARSRAEIPIATRAADLSHLEDHNELFEGRDLVTASALLDLVSERWLRRLLSICREARAAVLFALSYDGRIECAPGDPEDGRVRDLVNRHQRGDKGFGRALGPDAAARTAAILDEFGYEVSRERSDWTLQPESIDLQSQLIEGWAGAATQMAALAPVLGSALAPALGAAAAADAIDGWRARRIAHVLAHRSHLLVGHQDVAGCIREPRQVYGP